MESRRKKSSQPMGYIPLSELVALGVMAMGSFTMESQLSSGERERLTAFIL